MTFAFNPRRDVFMSHMHAKDHGQMSNGSKVTVETNGWTDGQSRLQYLYLTRGRTDRILTFDLDL